MAFKQKVATLFLSLCANAVALKTGLKEASNEVRKFKRSVDVELTSIRSLISGAAIAFETRQIVRRLRAHWECYGARYWVRW